MAQEFEKTDSRPPYPMPPPLPFPEKGLSEDATLQAVRQHLSKDPYKVEQNFGVSYVGPPHSITKRVAELSAGTFFAEWAREMNPGTHQLEKQAVRMMGSLLGNSDAVGFITSGGTESNISALRLARNLAKKDMPEVIMPQSAHYSFRVAAELMGLRLHEVPLDAAFRPKMDQVEALINNQTIALVCSAPDGSLGQLDPVAEFAEIALRHGLYLHVDAAFGGFFLPFMRELGYSVEPFDFSLPGVSSIMTDGHKLGLLPVATGFFLVRDEAMLQAIPTERTVIHNITATKPGDHAAAAWAVMQRLGRIGYRESASRVLEVVDTIVKGIDQIQGLRLVVKPLIPVVNFTSNEYSVEQIYQELRSRGWGATYGRLAGMPRIRFSIHPNRDKTHARQLIASLADSVAAVRDRS